ncbi:MAG: hypothetical protein V3S55_15150 [Nitrospiraceae bacterium]
MPHVMTEQLTGKHLTTWLRDMECEARLLGRLCPECGMKLSNEKYNHGHGHLCLFGQWIVMMFPNN